MSDVFETEKELDDAVSAPGSALTEEAAEWRGTTMVLGAGGKIGRGVAVMAQRASGTTGAVVAVSRWSDGQARKSLEDAGVRTIAADLSDPRALAGLPDASRIVYLVGTKFGTSAKSDEAWMTNTVLASAVAERYAGSRIAALSTGNVYPLSDAVDGGSCEEDPVGPVGEYAITCLGRERVLTHASRTHGTPVSLIRLNYACEPRYGVIADVARSVVAGAPIDLSVGAVNVVWQRYANEVILRSLSRASTPPFVLNLTGPETASIRRIAIRLGERLGVEPSFTGSSAPTALLSNAGRCHALFGYPDLSLGQLVDVQAEWIRAGGQIWDKPTKYERRDGQF